MALGQWMPVVRVDAVDRHAAGERGTGGARGAAVEEDPRSSRAGAGSELRDRVVTGDPGERRPTSRCGDRDQIEEARRRGVTNLIREVVERHPLQPLVQRGDGVAGHRPPSDE